MEELGYKRRGLVVGKMAGQAIIIVNYIMSTHGGTEST